MLCEGMSDMHFFDGLISERNIDHQYRVDIPHVIDGYSGGWQNFGNELKALEVSQGFHDTVKGILVVGDNDLDLAASFQRLQDQVRVAGYNAPEADRRIAQTNGKPAIGILMIPIGEIGALETVCLEAAYAQWNLREVVDSFVRATPAKDWDVVKQAKMRMQSVLAATHKKQPDAGFASHLRSARPPFRLNFGAPCFNGITDFLNLFPGMIEAT